MKNGTIATAAALTGLCLFLASLPLQHGRPLSRLFVAFVLCAVIGWGIFLAKKFFNLQKSTIQAIFLVVLLYCIAGIQYAFKTSITPDGFLDLMLCIGAWLLLVFCLGKTGIPRKFLLTAAIPSALLLL